MEASLQELPAALQQCRDECYGPLRLGRRMGFAQVYTYLLDSYWEILDAGLGKAGLGKAGVDNAGVGKAGLSNA